LHDEKVVVFIDGSNFYYAIKRAYGITRVDFQKLLEHLRQGRKLIRAYYHITSVPEEKDIQEARSQQRFLHALRRVPYLEIKFGRLEKRETECVSCKVKSSIWVEKAVDVTLAVDMVRMAYQNSYDTAVVVSGDGDFSAAVEVVKNAGKNVEFAYPNRTWARNPDSACDRFLCIEQGNI
jgi:uncharacterized LabA/DUF88 family protein